MVEAELDKLCAVAEVEELAAALAWMEEVVVWTPEPVLESL